MHLFLQTSRLNFKPTIGKIFEYFIESTLVDIGIPIEEMSRSDKKSFAKQVNENRVFLISGAVDRISATLEVSKQTIYNYLDEVQG